MSSAEFIDTLKRNPARVLAVLVALASAVGIYLVNDRIESATATLDQKMTEGARLAANVQYSAQLAEQLKALTDANSTIQSRSVQASQLANNLQYFYRLENESGIELLELHQSTSGIGSKAGGNGVGFSVSVKGDYVSLLRWLRRLENGPHYCRVISASMGTTGVDRNAALTLSVIVELFGQP